MKKLLASLLLLLFLLASCGKEEDRPFAIPHKRKPDLLRDWNKKGKHAPAPRLWDEK